MHIINRVRVNAYCLSHASVLTSLFCLVIVSVSHAATIRKEFTLVGDGVKVIPREQGLTGSYQHCRGTVYNQNSLKHYDNMLMQYTVILTAVKIKISR